jgi:hypothetical protein
MNVVALIQPREPTALEKIAEYINDQFVNMERAEARSSKARDAVANAETAADNARVRIGRALLDAKEKLKAEDSHASFEAWCGSNVRRAMRDCYTCMKLADVRAKHGCMSLATGAEAAIWERRDDQPQEASADGGTVQHQQNRSVQTAIGMYRKMTTEQREEVKRAQEEIDNA